ncbi:MAG: glycosyltransferase [Microscillaceae bacterium]|nr:glycosyltransferase [Microscillaceae bacterium]
MLYPKISIVTPSYNQGQYIEEAILSVIGQNYPNLEYIIIDGGSTDNTIEIIKKYEKHITYWVSEKDKGIYDAMNKGIDVATGEWIYFLGTDDLLSDNILIKIFQI